MKQQKKDQEGKDFKEVSSIFENHPEYEVFLEDFLKFKDGCPDGIKITDLPIAKFFSGICWSDDEEVIKILKEIAKIKADLNEEYFSAQSTGEREEVFVEKIISELAKYRALAFTLQAKLEILITHFFYNRNSS